MSIILRILQVTCGTELGLLLIQTMSVAKVPFDKAALGEYVSGDQCFQGYCVVTVL